MIDLAIVIVNFNVCRLLRRCLQTVFASSGDYALAVCVVDNNSSDGSVAMVRKTYPQVKLIANSDNVGYPTANNQGLVMLGANSERESERPRYCLLLNPDTEVPPSALAELVTYLDERPTVAVVGPKLVLPNGELDLACRRAYPTPTVAFYRMIGFSRLFPRSRRFGRYNMTFLDEDEESEVDSVVGAFMMVRTEAMMQVGMLDERFWMYGEDLDWAKRMKDAGWKVMYNPAVSALHVKRASSRQSRRASTEFYRAMLIFYYKHYREQTPVILHWMILLGIAAKGGRRLLADVAAGSGILQAEKL